MNKISSVILGIGLLTAVNAFASIPLGSTVLSPTNPSYTIDASQALHQGFLYDITCEVEGKADSDAVVRFDSSFFQQMGSITFDNAILSSQQTAVSAGNHTAVYHGYMTGKYTGGTATLALSYVIGTVPVSMTCSAYPTVGLKNH